MGVFWKLLSIPFEVSEDAFNSQRVSIHIYPKATYGSTDIMLVTSIVTSNNSVIT
jgi:hypothetical protein